MGKLAHLNTIGWGDAGAWRKLHGLIPLNYGGNQYGVISPALLSHAGVVLALQYQP